MTFLQRENYKIEYKACGTVGGEILGIVYFVELTFLNGREKLKATMLSP